MWIMLQSLLPEMLPPTAVLQQEGEAGRLVCGVSLRCLEELGHISVSFWMLRLPKPLGANLTVSYSSVPPLYRDS